MSAGSTAAANWAQCFPQRFREIYSKHGLLEGLSAPELKKLKATFHDLIWRSSRRNGGKQMLLKSPPQTGRLRMLLAMYPNAKFVFIRRDPYEVFKSNQKLWETFRDQNFQDFSAAEADEHILWSYSRIHEKFEQDRWLCKPGQLTELTFEDFQQDPVKALEQVYRELGLGSFESVRGRFESYVKAHHKRARPYELMEVELDKVEAALGPWLTAWNYHRNPPPVPLFRRPRAWAPAEGSAADDHLHYSQTA